jgi:hypothetical protein
LPVCLAQSFDKDYEAFLLDFTPLIPDSKSKEDAVKVKLVANLERSKLKQSYIPEEKDLHTNSTEEEKKISAEEDESFELEPQEFIFLIDRSGSMYYGNKAIIMAKEALKVFLHSLPEGSKFNIVGFGSR